MLCHGADTWQWFVIKAVRSVNSWGDVVNDFTKTKLDFACGNPVMWNITLASDYLYRRIDLPDHGIHILAMLHMFDNTTDKKHYVT